MFQILKITEMVVNYGIPIGDVVKVLMYILPPFMVFTVPMAFLLAVILGVGRLSSDSELMALKASGISLAQLYPPILVLSVLAYAASAFLALQADPWGKQNFKRMLYEVGRKNATLGLKPQIFNDRFENLVIYVDGIDPQAQTLTGVFIVDERSPDVPNIIIAQSGQLSSGENASRLVISLINGSIHRTLADPSIYENAHFERYDIVLDFAKAMQDDVYQKTYLEMTLPELRAYITGLRQSGKNTFEMRRAWTEYHKKFAFPFACVVFGLMAVPMGVSPPRSGRGQGFTMAIFILGAFYLMFRLGETLAWRAVIDPMVAMWAPNVIFGVLGVYFLWRKSIERPIWVMEKLAQFTDYVRKVYRRRAGLNGEEDTP
jgi:lipopolysaccharide export system permease protein